MPVTIPRSSRLRLSRRIARVPITAEEATYAEVYELLSEAADLVTLASRQLRYAKQTEAGFALQPVADEIHEHIRRLPASVSDRPAHRHHRPERSHS